MRTFGQRHKTGLPAIAGGVAARLLLLGLLLAGCSHESGKSVISGGSGIAGAGGGTEATGTNRIKVGEQTEITALGDQFQAMPQAQAQLIDRLRARIDQLEKKDLERTAATQSVPLAPPDNELTLRELDQKI